MLEMQSVIPRRTIRAVVGEREQRQALGLAFEAGATTGVSEFARCIVERAPSLIACEFASYNELNPAGANYVEVASEQPIAPELWQTFERLVDEHPLVRHYASTKDGRALRISDVIDRDAFRRLDLYLTFFAPLGIDHQVAVTLPSAGDEVIGLALSRGGPDFTEHDCEVLNLLRPYLARAHAHVLQVQELGARVAALALGADALKEGIVLLDNGVVEHVSEPARALLAEFFGSPGAAGQLPRGASEVLSAAGGREAFVVRGSRRLTLRPIGGASLGVLVLTMSPLPLEGYDLTSRELEMLSGVADGRTDGEIAAQLGLSPRTVERHLQNAYGKLGVHTRAAAVARVFGTRSDSA